MQPESITLRSGRLSATVHTKKLKLLVTSDEAPQLLSEQCRNALLQPLGLPELARCVVPGDSVAIVIDPETPDSIDLLVVVCEQLQSVPDEGITLSLMLPPDPANTGWSSFVERLPLHLQQQLTVHVHDPTETAQLSYVASSAAGERIYLNRRISDADLLITIGVICFNSLLGYQGTTSSVFPSFSENDAILQARAQGHPELTPDNERPYRQLVDEVGWLLGTQFAVQVVPGAGETPLAILAGLPEDVMSAGKEIVDRVWRVTSRKESEAILLSVPVSGLTGWKQFGTAIEQAAKIVEPDGRIIVIADLPIPEGPAATMLRRCQEPGELLKPLRREPTEDAVEIVKLINTLSHARIYLYSQIPADIVEELGMIAIEDAGELQRLTMASNNCVVLPNANYAWVG
jgi:nickel-dependent lactate racemase